MALYVRYGIKTKWEIDYNSCNIEREKQEVRSNKLNYYGFLIVGGLLVLGSIIGMICGLE